MTRDIEREVKELVSAYRLGSVGAADQLLELCGAYLFKIANAELDSKLGAKVGASDLVQTTHLKAKQKFDAFKGHSRAELFGWLRSILLNELRSNRRKLGREVNVEPNYEKPAGAKSPSSVFVQNENVKAIRGALQQLPAHYSKLIDLRDFKKMKFAEIGELTGQSPRAAAKCYWRAIEHLRRELESGEK